MKYSKKQVKNLLEGLYSGEINPDNLPEDLYFAIAEYLKSALYKGFGGGLSDFAFDGIDYQLLTELRENIYMFSAAKTYSEVAAMTDLLISDDTIRTFSDFRNEAIKIYEQYNVDWLKSEYNTAIASGEMAAKWNTILSQSDLLPNLRYSTTEVACPICAPLNDTVLPVNDAFWSTFYPPNHFNCVCVVLQEEADVKITQIPPDTSEAMQDVFKMNTGQDGVVFNEQSPYFTTAPKDKGINNFGLPIPDNDD
jgi:hypothetical protein